MAASEKKGGSGIPCECRSGPISGVARTDGATFNNKWLHYAEVDGLAIFEGDIVLGRADQVQADEAGNPVLLAAGVSGAGLRWPEGRIPYEIAADLPDPQRVAEAIAHWHANTPMRLAPRAGEADYVCFVPGASCSSRLGRAGGRQDIALGRNCGVGNAIHEIGHAVGLWHEQGRADRDQYVHVVFANIDPALQHNFNQHVSDGADLGPYDYGSVMHYPPTAFSSNGQPTLVPRQPLPAGVVMGQRSGLSAGDINGVRLMYPHLAWSQGAAGAADQHGQATAKEAIMEEIQGVTIKELSKDPIHDPTIKEASKDPIQDPTVKEASKDPIQDPTVKEVVKDPIHDPTFKEVGKDPIHDPTVKEISKDPIHDPTVKEAAKDPIHDPTIKEAAKDPLQDGAYKEAGKNPLSDAAGATLKEAAKDPIHDPTVKEAAKDPINDPTIKEAGKDPIHDPTIKEAGKDPINDPTAKELVKDPIQDPTAKELVKDPIRDPTIKELAKDPIRDVTVKELNKDPIKDAQIPPGGFEPPGPGPVESAVPYVLAGASRAMQQDPVAAAVAQVQQLAQAHTAAQQQADALAVAYEQAVAALAALQQR